GDLLSGGGDSGVPRLGDPLPGGEGPCQFPAVEGFAAVRHAHLGGESAGPFALDGVVDLASFDGLGGHGQGYADADEHGGNGRYGQYEPSSVPSHRVSHETAPYL